MILQVALLETDPKLCLLPETATLVATCRYNIGADYTIAIINKEPSKK